MKAVPSAYHVNAVSNAAIKRIFLTAVLLVSVGMVSGRVSNGLVDCAWNISISPGERDTPDCLKGRAKCGTLLYAFTQCHILNNSTFHVEEGVHRLGGDLGGIYNTPFGGMLTELRITGDGSDKTTIDGLGQYGLAFVNVTQLHISGIRFVNCSQRRPSTSFIRHGKGNYSSKPFPVGVYVWRCHHVFIHDIVVGSDAVGLVMYETTGNVTISHSVFEGNNNLQNGTAGGGGVNIEFPYCPPGHFNDSECGNNINFLTYASYTIQNCTFRNNTAHTINDLESQFILPNRSFHQAFGRGGGMAVYFSGNSSEITMNITHCLFDSNRAIYGAGLFAEFHDQAHNNTLTITHNTFTSNECYHFDSQQGAGGGGLRIAFLFYLEERSVMNNKVTIANCEFDGNRAYFGGGLSFLSGLEQKTSEPTNKLVISNCVWRNNYARLGSAAYFSAFNQVRIGTPPLVELASNHFENNSVDYVSQVQPYTIVGTGTVYCYNIPLELQDSNTFTYNMGTGIVAVGTQVKFVSHSSAVFMGNVASNGGGIATYANGWITLNPNTTLEFQNNTATGRGGALYAEMTGENEILTSRDCFIRYSEWWVGADKWNCSVNFDGNKANLEGNDIYMSSVYPCIWGGSYGQANTSVEVRQRVFQWDHFHYTQTKNSIASGISNVTWEGSGHPFHVSIIPGQLHNFGKNVKFYNDLNKNTTAPLLVSTKGQGMVVPTDSAYTINTLRLWVKGDEEQKEVVQLQSIADPPIMFQLNVSTLPCPPGAWLTPIRDDESSKACECAHVDDTGHLIGITCTKGDHLFVVYRTKGYWVGYLKDYRNWPVTASCPHYFCNNNRAKFGQIKLESEELANCTHICAPNRTGDLCGQCTPGHGIELTSLSYRCVECSTPQWQAWIEWCVLQLVITTIVVGAILLFGLDVTGGKFASFVFFSQTLLSLNIHLCQCADDPRGKQTLQNYQLIYSIWSLRFRYIIPNFNICLKDTSNVIFTTTVEYVLAIYPFVLIIIVALLAKCCKSRCGPHTDTRQRRTSRCNKLHTCLQSFYSFNGTFVIHGIATCFVITYCKLTFISLFILAPATINVPHNVNDSNGVSSRVWYYGHWKYFEPPHLYYALVALVFLFVFVILPPIFLMSYPAFPRLVRKCNKHWGDNIERFYRKIGGEYIFHLLSIFQNHYKDNCRFFAGMWFVYRLALDANNAFNQNIWSLFTVQIVLGVLFLLIHAIVQPYKENKYNIIDCCFFALIAFLSAVASQASQNEDANDLLYQIVIFVLLSVPYAYFLITVGYTILAKIHKKYKGNPRGENEPLLPDQNQVQPNEQQRAPRFHRPEMFYDSEESQGERRRDVQMQPLYTV